MITQELSNMLQRVELRVIDSEYTVFAYTQPHFSAYLNPDHRELLYVVSKYFLANTMPMRQNCIYFE